MAWAICGFAEQLEFLHRAVEDDALEAWKSAELDPLVLRERTSSYDGGRLAVSSAMLKTARATADFDLTRCCADGIPMWDTGAPNLHRLPACYLSQPADPFNPWEPVDSSAAAIAAQGLVRLGNFLSAQGDRSAGARYHQAGLTIARALFSEPYLSTSSRHQGLLLHSVYHRPNGWDYIAHGQKVPNGESSMWGDYHVRELALLLWREARGEAYLTFFDYL